MVFFPWPNVLAMSSYNQIEKTKKTVTHPNCISKLCHAGQMSVKYPPSLCIYPHSARVYPEGVQSSDPIVTVRVKLVRVDRLVVVNQYTRNLGSRSVSKSLE